MNITKSFVIFCVLCFLTSFLSAQNKKPVTPATFGSVSGYILTNSNGMLQQTDNVNVTLVTKRDTLHTTTLGSKFFFKRVPIGQAKIFISLVGYGTTTQKITVEAGKTKNYDFFLKENSRLLNEVVVKGKASPASLHGDTIVYNPKAVFIQEGDMAMDMVQQMPGVKVENGVVTVMGKEIKKTYVDGKLVFGKDPLNALNNLSATDIAQIRAFDEFDNKDSRKKLLQGEKIRVFNISTKSHLVSSFDTRLLGSAGSNIGHNDKGAFRKGAGITSNFFSEKFLFSINAFHNNMSRHSNNIREILSITDPGNTYKESTYIETKAERNWDKKNGTNGSLQLSYSFGLDKGDTDGRTEQNYFADANYNSRVYTNACHQHNIDRSHHIDITLNSNSDKWGGLIWTQGLQFDNSDHYLLNETSNVVDNRIASKSNLRNEGNSKLTGLMEHLYYSKNLGKKISLSFKGEFENRKKQSDLLRLDTLQSSSTHTYLTIPAHTRNTQANGELAVKWSVEKGYLEFTAGTQYFDGYCHQFAWNMKNVTNPVLDEANTYNYKNKRMEYNQLLSYTHYLSPDEDRFFNISAGVKESSIKRDEVKWDNYRKSFISPIIDLSYEDNDISHSYQINYRLTPDLPNTEQLRPQINNSDPYMLSCGNTNLKQIYNHSLSIETSHFLAGGRNVLSGSLMLNIIKDNIVSKSTYFTKTTYLPEQNYTAPAGSTLNSYANIQGTWNLNTNINWEHALRAIKSKYKMTVSYRHSNDPYFIGDNRITVRSDAPTLAQQLTGTPTRNIRWKFAETTQYYIYSGDNSSKNFVQTADCSLTLNSIFKVLYINASYQFTFNRTYGDAGNTNSMNVLNINLGCKVLKRQGDITFTAYDILGSHHNFASKVLANYVRNQWTNYYGRYFSINFAYHFGKVKSQYKGMLNDGSVRKN